MSYERYHRQMILPGFGEQAQQKIARARVLVIGAGGLGCPALQYLTAAGIGTIGIADGDTVSLSNLHRQVLFHTADIGKNKAQTAAAYLQQLNPDITFEVIAQHITTMNILETISAYEIVVDGTDNFATRYMINDACVLLKKTLVYGAVSRFEGQVAVFNYPVAENERSANYRDLFPEPPHENEVLNCSDAGVIGVLAGIIGSLQANEVIKMVTGLGSPLVNQLLTFNTLTNQQYTVKMTRSKNSQLLMPQSQEAFRQTDYAWLCRYQMQDNEIDARLFNQLIQQNNVDIVDVRELHEMPEAEGFKYFKIPLANIRTEYQVLKNKTVVVFCQSGKRSLQAAKQLSELLDDTRTIYSLSGGIVSWKEFCEMK